MKRVALIFLIGFSFAACDNIVDQFPDDLQSKDFKGISLKIYIPPRSITTYANEFASDVENSIDTLYINIYQGSSTPIHEGKFYNFPSDSVQVINDTTLRVGYEVDNLVSGVPTRVHVFANWKNPVKITHPNEVPIPKAPPPAENRNTFFFMSGDSTLSHSGAAYNGEVCLVRNVAKMRIHISKNILVIPSDLKIDYDNIRIEVINAIDTTTAFGGTPFDFSSPHYYNYTERTATTRRGAFDPNPDGIGGTPLSTGTGGLIDSLYLYENFRTSYDAPTSSFDSTKIKVTIPTETAIDGYKVASYSYTIYTPLTKYAILRNYIYTLDIKVKGQELDPLISLDVQPWNDDDMNGNINGTYLTLDKSEIVFDPVTGLATIKYCTDAQAIYFDFATFNNNNPTTQIGQKVFAVNIDTTLSNFPLAPDGFQDAQVLVDKQHCGSFGFQLDLNQFPQFPSVNFSGSICLRAGNIVKCLTFPARKTYDCHFIVGDSIFPGETFVSAVTSASWIKVSKFPYYTTTDATDNWSGNDELFLHLDENLQTGINDSRTGSIALTNNMGSEKIIYITQLPAINVGRFGYASLSTIDDSIYTAPLLMEQLYEFPTMPVFKTTPGFSVMPSNALYNGRFSAINPSVLAYTNYFDYQSAIYEAINYCAFKNRGTGTNGALTPSDIKWYLPSQAQLMGLWITYESYHYRSTSNFFTISSGITNYADIFWSSTANTEYENAQIVDFRFGNIGHNQQANKRWARCVRDDSGSTPMTGLISNVNPGTNEYPRIDFNAAGAYFPPDVYTSTSKNGLVGNDTSVINQKVFNRLRVAKYDVIGVYPWSTTPDPFSLTPTSPCTLYHSEDGIWRLPTQRELQAIWILQDEIKMKCPSFNKLSDDYYWSGTVSSESLFGSIYTHAWTTFGGKTPIGGAGNSPNQLKSSLWHVRCVQEQ